MSTKDFVAILNFFLGSVGNRLEIKLVKDYVEETIKSLEKLKYPYNLTKSSLKTPTAPHSLTNIIQLLSWLKNLHMHQLNQGWEDEFLFFRENIYPNLETQKYVQSISTDSFKIWNQNQIDEDDQQFIDLEEKAIGKIIHEKTGVSTISEFLQRNEQTRKKCHVILNDINNIKIPEEQEQKLLALELEFENNQSEIKVLEMNIKHMESENIEINTEIDRLQLQGKDMQEKLDKLKNAINGQKATVQERDSQVNKILHLEAKVNSVKNTLTEIQENGSNDIVMETRLMTKIPFLIGKLKNFMDRLENLTNSSIFENVCLEAYKDYPDLLKTVQEVQVIVEEVDMNVHERDNTLKQKIQVVKEDINILDQEISKLQCDINILIQKKADLGLISRNFYEEASNLQDLCTVHKSKLSSDLERKEIDLKNKYLILEEVHNKVNS